MHHEIIVAHHSETAITTRGHTYRLTAAGIRALDSEQSVPEWFRAILGVFHGDMTANEVLRSISSDLSREALTWLGQLDTLGFVEQVVPVKPGAASAEVTPGFSDDAVKVGAIRS